MAMNIEQRLEQSAKSIEQSSQKAHDFAEKDTTIQTCAGSRDSLPKVSRIWQENFARQFNKHATEFQDRFAISQQSLPWQAGITISDSLQRYHVGVQGEEGYKEFLPNPLKLPFETAATLAEDLTQDRWLENGVPNKHWTESKVTSALEKSLGVNARIWPKDRDLQVGDVIPSAQETADGLPITHLVVSGNAYAMSPIASGLVADLTSGGATINGYNVRLFSRKLWKEGGTAHKNEQVLFITPDGTEITVFNPSATSVTMGETPYSGGFVGVDALGVFVACDPSGEINANSAFSTASESVDFGTVIRFFGNPKIQGVCECNPVLFIGDGGTVTFDKTLDAGSDGMVFKQGTKVQFQVGMKNCTIKIVGSNGGSCFTTPVNNFVDIYPRVIFDNLSFHSDDAGSVGDGFEQIFSWQYYLKLGDSMNMTLSKIDALGSFVIENDPATQALDTLIRFEPTQGILSCRISNVTTHNVARYIEIKQKTYFHMYDIDIAQCYEGIVDAPDRVFESNIYEYGESVWRNVIINSQSFGINLANRYQLFAFGLIVNRAAGFDNGQDWIGVKLTKPRNCTLVTPSFSNAQGFTGVSKGVLIDGGECNSIISPSFGTLTHAVQVGETSSTNGSAQAVTITDPTILATVETVIVNRNSRGLKVKGFNKNSATKYTNFITHGDVLSRISSTITDAPSAFTIRHEDRIEIINDASPSDEKRTIIDTTNGLTVQTRTDADGIGQNALIIERNGVQVTRSELRASPTIGVINLNAPEVVIFGTLRPSKGNAFTCGTASQPWSGGFTQTAFTVTSDINYKQDVEYDLTSLIAAWSEVKYASYRLKDRVNLKGEQARHHIGLIAQDIKSAFEKHGIDPFKYGILCYDEWDASPAVYEEIPEQNEVYDDQGNLIQEYRPASKVIIQEEIKAGGRYSVNYDEAMCLEAALIRSRIGL
ncbi:tail fiber domain-containing protein [Vibrio cholerae]